MTGHRWLGALTLTLALWAPAAHGQLASVSRGAQGVAVTLTWAGPVQVTSATRAGRTTLSFSRVLDVASLRALGPQLHPWVTGIHVASSALTLVVAPHARVVARADGNVVHLWVGPARAGPQAPTAVDPRARLKLLKAALLWSTGDPWGANRLLDELLRASPKRGDLLAAKSVAERRLDRWRRASEALDAVPGARRTPGAPPAGSAHAPRVDVVGVHQRQGDTLLRRTLAVTGHGFVTSGVRLATRAEVGGTDLPGTRFRGALTLRHDLRSGSWWSVTGFGAPEQSGGRATVSLWDRLGRTELRAGRGEARWDLPSLMRLRTSRDAVTLRRTLRALGPLGRLLRGNVTAEVSVALERWQAGTETLRDVFASASLRYVSWMARPQLEAGWTVLWLRPLNAPATPQGALAVTLAKTQIHLLTGGLRVPLWRWWSVAGFVGYGFSVHGEDAVQAGVSTAWEPPSGLTLSASYRRGVDPASYGLALDGAQAQIGWRW